MQIEQNEHLDSDIEFVLFFISFHIHDLEIITYSLSDGNQIMKLFFGRQDKVIEPIYEQLFFLISGPQGYLSV